VIFRQSKGTPKAENRAGTAAKAAKSGKTLRWATGKCAEIAYRALLTALQDQTSWQKRSKSGRAAWSDGKSAILMSFNAVLG
jgi:hypothetical protein